MEETAILRWDEKRHRNGQEAHEKILNKNANQNYNEVLPHISQNGHDQKLYKPINAKEGMEKREPSYTVGGNVNWQPLQSLCGSDGKESAMLEARIQSLCREDPLEKGIASHPSILAWRMP